MKTAIAAALAALFIYSPAHANCFGTSTMSTCYDDSGNSYNVQRFGDQTFMHGSNARTGSSWSQNSLSIGDTTFHNGTDSDGNSWNSTTFGDDW